jgi:hypothetical protein
VIERPSTTTLARNNCQRWSRVKSDQSTTISRCETSFSMSRKGNCHDNAVAESFFSNLKNELTHHTIYPTRKEAKAAIFDYIELFYNRMRPHQTLGYRTPVEVEALFSAA